ncbi:MAG: 1-aminocyclopropane-1-carboxylate deaminase/D-cysteine desulfhydrase [Bdellovibrionales bacterium]
MTTKLPKREPLALLPTPIILATNLSKRLGFKLLIKDESFTGFAIGGNKIRSLEFLLGDHENWDTLILCGGPTSNFIRAAAVGALHLGKKVICSFYGSQPTSVTGNFLILKLMQIECHFSGSEDRATSESKAEQMKEIESSRGDRVKVLPRGGALPEAVCGFYLMQEEINLQLGSTLIDHLIVPIGTGTMIAGLWLNKETLRNVSQIWGFCSSRPKDEITKISRELALEASVRFGLPGSLKDRLTIRDDTLGAGYGKVNSDVLDVVRQYAQAEGIFLDPVFNGKSALGLRNLVNEGKVQPGQCVLLINGGGLPEIFSGDFN